MIKVACSYALFLFLTVSVFFIPEIFAQHTTDSQTPPELVITSKSWRLTQIPPLVNPEELEADPQEYQRSVVQNIQDNKRRAARGLPNEREPLSNSRLIIPMDKRNLYIYEVRLKNISEKTIRAVTWEYVFSEPGTKRELGRKRFVSKVKIRPGEEKKISEKLASPPSYLVGAKVADSGLNDQYSEEILIRSIEY
ncbi:MAG TPA: hypothetical protein VF596_06140 [Pyrinomonadaceae bacterium]|jgi:hypothetical protein